MRLWLSVCACVLVPVGGGPPARSPHASCARSGRSRSPARPCRRPPAPRPGPPVSSTPVGPLRLMVLGASARCPARPCRRPPAPRPGPPMSSTPVGHSRLMVLGASAQCPARPCRRVACFVGPGRCVCRWAAARPRDRHTRASLGVVDLEARPGPAASHQHRGQAPQASRRPRSVGLVVCVLTGSAVAHLRRGQVLQPLRRPPHRRGLVCWCVVRRSVISHAIRRPHCAGLYQFVMLRHLCL